MESSRLESIAIAILLTSVAGSGQIPQTDLYAFKLTEDDSAHWHIHTPLYLSAWNPEGYTNQPEWVDAHTLLVSVRKKDAIQNDIYLLDLKTQLLRRMTDTPESEFSPMLTPDQKHFSVVRQVQGTVMDQQIFSYPIDLAGPGQPVLPRTRNVGYYCWLDNEEMALYLVDDPDKLALWSGTDSIPRIYSSMIGRCLRRTPSGKLAYVHKYSDDYWYLKTLNLSSRTSEILNATLPGKEDFAIGPTGCYFMASGTTLYVFDPAHTPAQWVVVSDLGIYGLHDITRLAISPDNQIAIVDQKGE